MSGAGSLDLRLPIGGLFTVLGLIIGAYGLVTNGDAEHYAPSSGLNINLWWGLVMLVFGVVFLLGARRSARTTGMHPAADSPQGRATERREHDLGLEK